MQALDEIDTFKKSSEALISDLVAQDVKAKLHDYDIYLA